MEYPPMEDPNNIALKHLTLKSVSRDDRLVQASKKIKECMKNLKQMESDQQAKADHKDEVKLEQITTNRGMQRKVMENLVIRPNLTGKKTVGSLEIHENGVRFNSSKGQKVDICFSNVKHAFFQPCAADDLIVIIHFTLKQPIRIGEKPTSDVQFYKESGIAAEDINFKGRSKMGEMEELEQEEAERQQRKRMNKRFLDFSKLIENAAEKNHTPFEVDIPIDELAFQGCPQRQVVKIRPTKECLVAISEFPFFVQDINEIELVHFERMFYGMKNFDLVIVFKDFQSYRRIDSIPMERADDLKSYFNEINIIFIESQASLKWEAILSHIRDDFEGWLEQGAWKQLVDESDDEGGEGDSDDSAEEDPVCSYGDEEESESESDDYSEIDSDEESSDVASGDDLSEEGQDWDDLEKEALEEDRKQNLRREPEIRRGAGAARSGQRRR